MTLQQLQNLLLFNECFRAYAAELAAEGNIERDAVALAEDVMT